MVNISKNSLSNAHHAMTTWCITSVKNHFFSLIVHTAAAAADDDDDREENLGGYSEDEDGSMSGIWI